ncbi:MAG: YitT family protein [Rikenellaceae bacterium]|jgi:uncharacterized membrane-anchored protein YitT (DUF2179 family)|nr:YitT family protein [Rikenellaceae bacterium]
MAVNTKQLYLSVKDDMKSWKWWSSWLVIIVGCTIMSLGFILFMYPYKITPGGIWGFTVVLHEIFPAIPQGWFGYMMEVPLLITGFAIFGPVFGSRTVFASMLTPLLMLGLPYLVFPDVAQQTAETLLWGRLDLSDDLILASIFGAIFIGAGVGLVVRSQATTGGTDIIAMILRKYTGMKFSSGVLLADAFVVLSSMIVLVGIYGESPTLPLYSLLTIWVSSKIIDLVSEGANNDKLLFILSERQDEIRDFILCDLDRSGTLIKSKGLYTDREKNMIFLVVSRREIVAVKRRLRDIDPTMFVVVVDANETLGEGFKPFAD